MNTIWGKAQTCNQVAHGITEVSTASHGGFVLSAKRMAEMPKQYKACSFTKDNHFEEDCSWCAVVMAWPEYFDSERKHRAEMMFNRFYAHKASHA